MGDLEQTSENGGAASNGGSSRLPARNMADIARLFLDGARPTPPRRTPPKASVQPQPQPVARPAAAAEEKPLTTVLGLAADTGSSWKLLTQAAQGLAAEHGTSVAIVGLMENAGGAATFIVDVVGVESTEELPVVRTATEAAAATTADLQIARALHRLRPAVGVWIIAAPAVDGKAFPAVSSIAKQWLLACPTDNDGLVAAYQLLKHAFSRAEQTEAGAISPAVFLLSDDYAHAAVVHKRLRKAAQEFLHADLALAGAGLLHQADRQATPPIRVLSIACNAPQDALWAALLDELCPMGEPEETRVPAEVETALEHVEARAAGMADAAVRSAAMAFDHLAQVLDPEERDALTAGLYDVPSPVSTPRAAVPTVAEVRSRPEMESRPQPVKIPVQVAEVPPQVPVKPETRKPKTEKEMVPVAPLAAHTRTQARDVAQAVAGLSAAPIGVTPAARQIPAASLRAVDMASVAPDRTAQWEAVERSIWDLSPKSALLDAKPPMSWATETCISIDAAGRLNVWTLFKDASGGASWFALREWAREHKKLLALTRRDLTIDAEADVAVHIVLPLEGEAGADVMLADGSKGDPVPVLMRAAAKHVHLYRLRTVNWNGKQGLIVVPIA